MRKIDKENTKTVLAAQSKDQKIKIWREGTFTRGFRYYGEADQTDYSSVIPVNRENAEELILNYPLREFPDRLWWRGIVTGRMLPISTYCYWNTPTGLVYALKNAAEYKGGELTVAQSVSIIEEVQKRFPPQ